MMAGSSNGAKLLIIIVNGGWEAEMVEALREAGAPGCTKIWGENCTGANLQRSEGRDGVTVLFSFIPGGADLITAALERAAAAAPGLTMTVLVIDGSDGTGAVDDSEMENSMKLIVSIVNHGHTEELMAAARVVGAKGGTVLNAKGTGTEDDAQFFGISLAPEKDMLLILAESGQTEPIVRAINSQPILSAPGGGIVFTLNVDQALFSGFQP